MTAALASIEVVDRVEAIEFADRIERARIGGRTVVVAAGWFRTGDRCVLIRPGATVPEAAWSGFLRPSGFRVRARRTRGVTSEGLALPTSILPPSARTLGPGADVTGVLRITRSSRPVVRIVSAMARPADALAAYLEDLAYDVAIDRRGAPRRQLAHGLDLPTDAVDELWSLLGSLACRRTSVSRIEGADLELQIGPDEDLSACAVEIVCEDRALGDRIAGDLVELGLAVDRVIAGAPAATRIETPSTDRLAIELIVWALRRRGLPPVRPVDGGRGPGRIRIELAREAGRRVELESDHHPSALELAATLGRIGLARVGHRMLEIGLDPRFEVVAGPLGEDGDRLDDLVGLLEETLDAAGVDRGRFPLEVDAGPAAETRIRWPLRAVASGRLPPYAGAAPDRWRVVLRTDCPDRAAPLVEGLRRAGYERVAVGPLPESCLGFRLRWGAAADEAEVTTFVTDLVTRVARSIEPEGRFPVHVEEPSAALGTRIEIDLPTLGFDDGSRRAAALAGCRDHTLNVHAPEARPDPELLADLEALGFRSVLTGQGEQPSPVIEFGGAAVELVAWLAAVVESRLGVRPDLRKEWPDTDDEIRLTLSPAGRSAPDEPARPVIDFDVWANPTADVATTPLIEFGPASVRIGPIELPRRPDRVDPLVPDPGAFVHYCLDQTTARTLVHVAESVALGEPCLLEGETSVSKTSIILLLASWTGQPVVRLNLNGQTDTGELIGRFVPQDTDRALPRDPDELDRALEPARPESRAILETARRETRPLTAGETRRIASGEHLSVHPWRWQDGLVVGALRHGWWLILDELNLAEPQVLERLNSILERHPSLVLTEGDQSVLGPGGAAIDPAFRIFATMNPAGTVGRSALSPAYRDRWRGHLHVEPPGETGYRAMLHYVVTGQEPDVWIRGRHYAGRTTPPALGALADAPGIEPFLSALARFHAAVESAAGRSGGHLAFGRRREGYVFSRRGLLALLDYLALDPGAERSTGPRSLRTALLRYYLDRVEGSEDRARVVELLDAAGIGPTTWTV